MIEKTHIIKLDYLTKDLLEKLTVRLEDAARSQSSKGINNADIYINQIERHHEALGEMIFVFLANFSTIPLDSYGYVNFSKVTVNNKIEVNVTYICPSNGWDLDRYKKLSCFTLLERHLTSVGVNFQASNNRIILDLCDFYEYIVSKLKRLEYFVDAYVMVERLECEE